jgi:truncated hemoglobin YjbI
MADPTVELRNRALFLSELSFEEAFELDNINLSKKIGEFNIIRIGEIFSSRLYKDPDDNFRSLFSSKLEEDHALDFSDYLLQRLGGKNDYSKSKGPPLLPARHINVNISIDSARRWYGHMQDTLEELVSFYFFIFIKSMKKI